MLDGRANEMPPCLEARFRRLSLCRPLLQPGVAAQDRVERRKDFPTMGERPINRVRMREFAIFWVRPLDLDARHQRA